MVPVSGVHLMSVRTLQVRGVLSLVGNGSGTSSLGLAGSLRASRTSLFTSVLLTLLQ